MVDRKYMFDLDFDRPQPAQTAHHRAEEEEPDDEPEIEAEPPPPMFSEEDLLLTRESAFNEGREAGLEEAGAATERLLATALATLTQQMDGVSRQQDDANDTNARAAIRVAMAVLKKMLPAACERHAFDEVTRVVEEVVGHVLDEPRIIVRVAAPWWTVSAPNWRRWSRAAASRAAWWCRLMIACLWAIAGWNGPMAGPNAIRPG